MRIYRRGPEYHIGDAIAANLQTVAGAVRARKKPLEIFALQIHEPFEVETTEGIMAGKPGDWLMQGVAGELYICPAHIFSKSYDVIK